MNLCAGLRPAGELFLQRHWPSLSHVHRLGAHPVLLVVDLGR